MYIDLNIKKKRDTNPLCKEGCATSYLLLCAPFVISQLFLIFMSKEF